MEKLVFKKSGFWYNIWKLTYAYHLSDTPPDDTCSYRWQLLISSVVALVFLPITIIRFIYGWLYRKYNWDTQELPENMGLLGYIIMIAIFTLSWLVGAAAYDEDGVLFRFKYIAAGFAILFSTIIITVTVALLIMYISEKESARADKRRRAKKDKKPGTIATLYKGWREKYCTGIKWVVKDE